MTTSSVSQKEYLKRYLSGNKDDKKKKKKKKSNSQISRLKLVDDNTFDTSCIQQVDTDVIQLYDLAENAPQIAGFVDDRPAELQALDSFQDASKWKVIADEYEDVKIEVIHSAPNSENEGDLSPPRFSNKPIKQEPPDEDISPPRDSLKSNKKSRQRSDSDLSPDRSRKRKVSDSDLSPPRHANKQKSKRGSDSDLSPPRRSKHRKRTRSSDSDLSPPRGQPKKSQNHPPRKGSSSRNKKNSDSDLSPPRVQPQKSQNHPPRKGSSSRNKKNSDSDLSPPRVQPQKSQNHPPRKGSSSRNRKNSDSDLSPPRVQPKSSKQGSVDSDLSRSKTKQGKPQRYRPSPIRDKNFYQKGHYQNNSDSDMSPPSRTIKIKEEVEESPKRNKKRSRFEPQEEEKRTLDGKKAGLQDAKALKEDTERRRAIEDAHFQQMSDQISGRGAQTIVRDRKTGRKRDVAKEEEEKLKAEQEKKEKLERFKEQNKGLVQLKAKEALIQDMLHESAKPFARYADDHDLESMLRNQEREGDPMLEYLREKKQHENPQSVKPRYNGPAPPPNRFNIWPGHKWDGVDRSVGFEKKVFEQRNAKKALEEEAYKWSVADM